MSKEGMDAKAVAKLLGVSLSRSYELFNEGAFVLVSYRPKLASTKSVTDYGLRLGLVGPEGKLVAEAFYRLAQAERCVEQARETLLRAQGEQRKAAADYDILVECNRRKFERLNNEPV